MSKRIVGWVAAGVLLMINSVPIAVAAEEEIPWLVPPLDYHGGLWQRPVLTGDWAGQRQQLMDKGLRIDVNLTQTLQGNVDGGVEDELTYVGGVDFGFKLDTGHAGLWPGGMLVVRGEARYGDNNEGNSNTGALLPVNTDAMYPVISKEDELTLSELYYVQFLAKWAGFLAGKISPRDTNVFAHDETTQFFNAAFNFNPVIGTTIPQSFLGAGVILIPAQWLMVTTLVLDSEGSADTSGFDTVFEPGTTVFQSWEATIKPFGLPGHQHVGWSWSDKDRIQFTQSRSVIINTLLCRRFDLFCDTAGLVRGDEDHFFLYDFDQYLYLEPGTAGQGIGIFGRFGLGDEDVNPIGTFYSLGISGKGMIPGRRNDTFGIAYYYMGLSDKLPRIIKQRTQDEQGVELYYNFAVTPWFHLTPDIQIIEPVRSSVDTTVVMGGRVKIDF